MSAAQICQFAILGALIYVCKMAMAPLPNIEPVTLLVILMAVVWGWPGLWSVYLYIFLEFCTWGVNLWNIYYIYIWLLLFIAAMKFRTVKSPFLWACIGAAFGMSFGALCAAAQIAVSGFSGALAWWISGIPFDLTHGAGNFVLIGLLFTPLKRLLESVKR